MSILLQRTVALPCVTDMFTLFVALLELDAGYAEILLHTGLLHVTVGLLQQHAARTMEVYGGGVREEGEDWEDEEGEDDSDGDGDGDILWRKVGRNGRYEYGRQHLSQGAPSMEDRGSGGGGGGGGVSSGIQDVAGGIESRVKQCGGVTWADGGSDDASRGAGRGTAVVDGGTSVWGESHVDWNLEEDAPKPKYVVDGEGDTRDQTG